MRPGRPCAGPCPSLHFYAADSEVCTCVVLFYADESDRPYYYRLILMYVLPLVRAICVLTLTHIPPHVILVNIYTINGQFLRSPFSQHIKNTSPPLRIFTGAKNYAAIVHFTTCTATPPPSFTSRDTSSQVGGGGASGGGENQLDPPLCGECIYLPP